MYDYERITKITSDIEKYLKDLDDLNINDLSDLDDKKNLYSSSMVLFVLINRAIDLGNEIISENKLGAPSTYSDVFKILSKNKIIKENVGRNLIGLARYRNSLSHQYEELTEEDILNIKNKSDTFREFVAEVKIKIADSNHNKD